MTRTEENLMSGSNPQLSKATTNFPRSDNSGLHTITQLAAGCSGPQSPLWWEHDEGGLVVFAFNNHLLSGPLIPIAFFRALFLQQLVSRHVLLHLVVRHYRVRRLDRRQNHLN